MAGWALLNLRLLSNWATALEDRIIVFVHAKAIVEFYSRRNDFQILLQLIEDELWIAVALHLHERRADTVWIHGGHLSEHT